MADLMGDLFNPFVEDADDKCRCQHCGTLFRVALRAHEAFCDLRPEVRKAKYDCGGDGCGFRPCICSERGADLDPA